MVAALTMVTALLIGVALGRQQARANLDWRATPVAHAADGPVVAR
jgi:hypothetical protein